MLFIDKVIKKIPYSRKKTGRVHMVNLRRMLMVNWIDWNLTR